MKRLVPVFCFLAILTVSISAYLPAQSGEADADDEDEALVLNLSANWKLANQRWVKNEHVVQYLPAGADKNNPAELLTVTTVTNVASGQDAKTYILQVKQAIESAKESAVLNWRLVKDSPNDASCEYSLSGHTKIPNQHEIMRVIRGGAELHSIIYHFGKLAITEPEKERAWSIVNDVKLARATDH